MMPSIHELPAQWHLQNKRGKVSSLSGCLYQFIANLKKKSKIYDALTSQSIFSSNKKHWAETRMHVCFHAQGKAMRVWECKCHLDHYNG